MVESWQEEKESGILVVVVVYALSQMYDAKLHSVLIARSHKGNAATQAFSASVCEYISANLTIDGPRRLTSVVVGLAKDPREACQTVTTRSPLN